MAESMKMNSNTSIMVQWLNACFIAMIVIKYGIDLFNSNLSNNVSL